MLNNLKEKLTIARKTGMKLPMMLLQVIIGEVATQQGRSGKELTDVQIENIIRGIVTKNNESLVMMAGKGYEEKEMQIKSENSYLNLLLPQTLTVTEIKIALVSIIESLKTANNSGMATGIAVKFCKLNGLKVLGEDVKIAVEQIRYGDAE